MPIRSTLVTVSRLAALMPLFLLAGCTSWLPDAHKLEVTQGSAIKREQLESLQPGMTRSEITDAIGSPTLQDPFHPQRWDYLYRHLSSDGKEQKSRLTLFFDKDTLVRIDDSDYVEPPDDSEQAEINGKPKLENERDPNSTPSIE